MTSSVQIHDIIRANTRPNPSVMCPCAARDDTENATTYCIPRTANTFLALGPV